VSDGNELDPHMADRNSVKKAISALGGDLDRRPRRLEMPHLSMPGWLGTALKVLAVLVIVGPVMWVLLYGSLNPPGTILMLQRWLGGADIRHQNVKAEDISPHLIRAVMAAEDARFCEHKGFDMEAIQAAYAANIKTTNQKKGKMRGGSTISQQTAKNLFLWPDRSFVRKGAEAYFTFLIEHLYPKRRIMQHYLNIAEFGPGLFGAQAASRAYFNVSVGELSPRQASLLAAILPSPNKWSASRPGPYVRRRAASIEARMYGIHAQKLDTCVLDPKAAPPPRRKGAPSTLPPLEALPLDVAIASDGPMMLEATTAADIIEPTESLAAPSSFEDGQLEAPEAPEEPAGAPEEAPSAAPAP
jgi:monofunctional biosynthetic peptidoglycan transglycosylase